MTEFYIPAAAQTVNKGLLDWTRHSTLELLLGRNHRER